MDKALMISIVPATVWIAAIAARDPKPMRGIRRALGAQAVFTAVYVVGLLYVLPRFS